jgi:5'-3' exoribonuclease 2
MGIKHFWRWFNDTFDEDIYALRKSDTINDLGSEIDVTLVDMNGIFHNAAQKVYEYGNFKRRKSLMNNRYNKIKNTLKNQIKVFETVCQDIEEIIAITRPKKSLVLCVDGCAPLSKQAQQRQRRFRAAIDMTDDISFDSTSITPGTKFMDYLTKYIDWYIRKKISEGSNFWKDIEVVFSNEKVPGEGEHKLINYLRNYGSEKDTYCLHGLDADLIMLALGTHLPNFFILREDMYSSSNDFFCIDIGNVRHILSEIMEWQSDIEYNPESGVNDFIFICFIVGNDFLPHIPSIEIIEGGIDVMIDAYKETCSISGHLSEKGERLTPGDNKNNHLRFRNSSMKNFLALLGSYEQKLLETKLEHKGDFFKDQLLEDCAKESKDGTWSVNIEKYRYEYICKHFPPDINVEKLCHEYLQGMQWVLTYYTEGVPHWKWNFPYHYTPSAKYISKYVDSFKHVKWKESIPSTPFQQLLSVLPGRSANLLPNPLDDLLTNKKSRLAPFCPDEIEVDLSGVRREWEGIVKIPMVDFEIVREIYFERVREIIPVDLKRNVNGRSFLYVYDKDISGSFNSYYGNILNCKCTTKVINL